MSAKPENSLPQHCYKSAEDWLSETADIPGAEVGDLVSQLTPIEAAKAGFNVARTGLFAHDQNVEANRQLLLSRSIAGIAKYGTSTERDDLTAADWCQHTIEELLDAANYLQALKKKLESTESRFIVIPPKGNSNE